MYQTKCGTRSGHLAEFSKDLGYKAISAYMFWILTLSILFSFARSDFSILIHKLESQDVVSFLQLIRVSRQHKCSYSSVRKRTPMKYTKESKL